MKLERELAEALAAHPALVRASADAWVAMCKAQEVSRAAREAEHDNLGRIEFLLSQITTPEGIPSEYKQVWF